MTAKRLVEIEVLAKTSGTVSSSFVHELIAEVRARKHEEMCKDAHFKDRLANCLNNLFLMVKGECPSLLEDDHHFQEITDALESWERYRNVAKP
jgi:hypothetical protein